MSFRPVGQSMAIVYKITGGESAPDAAIRVLEAYSEAAKKNKEEKEINEQQ